MSIITVGGIKGGSGKTTTAINITIALSNLSNDVLLVDADDQESATDFTNWRNHSLNTWDREALTGFPSHTTCHTGP